MLLLLCVSTVVDFMEILFYIKLPSFNSQDGVGEEWGVTKFIFLKPYCFFKLCMPGI